jgi:hypothetical protein
MESNCGRSPLDWARDNFIFLAGAIYLIVNGILLITANPNSSEWDQVFVLAAKKLVAGADIYSVAPWSNPVTKTPPDLVFQITHPFTYPPFHALTALLALPLPHVLSRAFWFVVQAISLTIFWTLSWKLTGGKPLNRGRWTVPELIICALGLIAGMRYIQGVFGHQQSDILIDALLVGGCFFWTQRRDFLAATAWAIAAAFKGPPLLMAPYLAWRGRWLAATWMVVLTIALNLLPDAIHRAPEGVWLTAWKNEIIKPTSSQIGAWYVDVIINQSIAGTAHRYFTTGWNFEGGKFVITYGKQLLAPKMQKLIVYAIDAALLAAVFLAMKKPFRRPDANTAVLECATVFILMLLLSPMSHLTHFGLLMFPGFLVARMAIERNDRVAMAAILIVVVIIGLLDHFPYRPIGGFAAWMGNVMWGAVALGVACYHALLKWTSKQSYPADTREA